MSTGAEPAPWTAGDVVSERYTLVEEIGHGAFGQVWRATDAKRGGSVALKVLVRRPEVTDAEYEQQRSRFRTEAEQAWQLGGGPHIVRVLDWDEHAGRPYIVMPYEEGTDLRRLLLERGPLGARRAAAVVGQVCDALDYIHSHRRVHRDVKPANILVRRIGEADRAHDHADLLDFGIVGMVDSATWTRNTPTAAALGSIAYMAPERFPVGTAPEAPIEPDERFDVYGLSCVLHECLTGQHAFDAEDWVELFVQHRGAPRPRPSAVDPALAPFDDVVARGLAVDPADRTPTVVALKAAVLRALDRWETGSDPRATVVPPARPVVEPSRWSTRGPGSWLRPGPRGRPPAAGSARPWEPALFGGGVLGSLGCVAALVTQPGPAAGVAVAVTGWALGAGGWTWWTRRRDAPHDAPHDGDGAGPGVSTPQR